VSLIDGDAEAAIRAYQTRVGAALNTESGRAARFAAQDMGVPNFICEILLCTMLARYELIPCRIELMQSVRRDVARARLQLDWIERVIGRINRIADQTTALFDFTDPTRIPDDVLIAVRFARGGFKNSAEAERLLRAEMGIPLRRLAAWMEVAQKAAIGYFAVEMQKRAPDGHPHLSKVVEIVNVFIPDVEYADVQHARAAFLRLQECV
jgi:hypothetical protein